MCSDGKQWVVSKNNKPRLAGFIIFAEEYRGLSSVSGIESQSLVDK